MSTLKLSPPWVTFFKEIKALFSQDPQIKPVFDQEESLALTAPLGEWP